MYANTNLVNVNQNQTKNKDIKVEGISSFRQTNINNFLLQCLQKCGFICPTPIQYYSILTFLNKIDYSIIGQSKSGTGKTLAFLIPILHDLIDKKLNKQTVCLIILPTRQLSVQVYQYLKQILNSANEIKPKNEQQRRIKQKFINITSLLTIGGIPIEDDKKTLLMTGANFVVGTIGRIYQLLQTNTLIIEQLRYVVFDQGDKLFQTKDDKLEKIIKRIKSLHGSFITTLQTAIDNKIKFRYLVFSATFTQPSLKKLSFKLCVNTSIPQKFVYIQTLTNENNKLITKVTQNLSQLNFINFQEQTNKEIINLQNIKKYWIDINSNNHSVDNYVVGNDYSLIKKVENQNAKQQNNSVIKQENIKKPLKSIVHRKCAKLTQILQDLTYKKCLIFVQKKALLDQINQKLSQFEPLVIHGSLSQSSRLKVMNQANNSKIIISSDLLARGIDLIIDLVILYDANINQTFWHRIGRTGRFGRIGVVVSLDQIPHWNLYSKSSINHILSQNQQLQSQNQQLQLKKSTNKTKKQWYGTYMTQYGRWQDVDQNKQIILNHNYQFFDQKIQNQLLQEEFNKKMSKKLKKQLKSLQKQNQKCQRNCIQQLDDIKIERSYKSKQQFLQKFGHILHCVHCISLMQQTSNLTQYSFSLLQHLLI